MAVIDELVILVRADIAQLKAGAAQGRAALTQLGVSAERAGAATTAGMAQAGAATTGMAATSTTAAATTTGAFATIGAAARTLGATLMTALPMLGVAAGLMALYGALKKGVGATADLESATILLTNSLRNSDDVAGDVEALKKRAGALEMASRYGDDQILTTMQLLATYGMEREEIEKSTQAIIDLSVAKGIDLRSATDLVGKAYAGQLGTLSRYGIIVERTGDKEKDFANVLKLINDNMSGSALADVQTFSGATARLGNVFSDLLRGVGDALVPALTWLANTLTWVMGIINRGSPLLDSFYEKSRKIGAVINVVLGPALRMLGHVLKVVVGNALKAMLIAWNYFADAMWAGIKLIVRAYNWLAERLGWAVLDLEALERRMEESTRGATDAVNRMALNTEAPLGAMKDNLLAVGDAAAATTDIMAAFRRSPKLYMGGRGVEAGGYSAAAAYNLGLIDAREAIRRGYTPPSMRHGSAEMRAAARENFLVHVRVALEESGVKLAEGVSNASGRSDYTING
ncbi:MAG: hypothetical protein ACXQS4_02430 [Methermicoccaceae archaeon]